jgi:hypothetical protein
VADDLVQPDERAQIAADLHHHWPTQIECLAAADQIEADAAEIERLRAEVAARTESGQIACLADIREAVGDPTGKLMQDELVALVRELAELRRRVAEARVVEVKQAGDDEDGNARIVAHSTRDELAKGGPLVFKRFRLLPEEVNDGQE